MNILELHTAAPVIVLFLVFFPKLLITCEAADNIFKFYTEKE